MNALVEKSCLKGGRHNLKVPSTYHRLASVNFASCSSVAKITCRPPRVSTSARRKCSGMLDSSITNSRSVGSGGPLACLQRSAALANVSGFGSVSKAVVVSISSNKTLSTIADAGRKKSSVAFRLMAAVNFAVSASPTSPGWLWPTPTLKSSRPRWMTEAAQWFDFPQRLQCQNTISFCRRLTQ